MRRQFETKITTLFGIDYPIIQGAMAWLSKAELVSAVSNAGGLGVLGASRYTLDEFADEVRRTKSLTDRPFAVNFPLVLGEFDKHLDFALAEGVKIVFVSAGSPKVMTPKVHEAGALCVHVVPNLKLAEKVAKAGVDAVVLESFEAGGHVSREGITAITNIPTVSKTLDLPIIAAGGIVDGRGMAAALALGADAIQMGTRFLATKENNASQVFKDMIVDSKEGDATIYSGNYHPGRALKSPAVEKIHELEDKGASVEEVRGYVGRGRGKMAAEGDYQEGLFHAGSGAGLIDDVPSVAELIDRILSEYDETLARLEGLMRFQRLALASAG